MQKTSAANLEAKDNNKWTVTHHLVSPMNYGTYDNEEIFYVLNKVGTPLATENGKGETPLKMALKIGAVKLAARLDGKQGEDAEKKVQFCAY